MLVNIRSAEIPDRRFAELSEGDSHDLGGPFAGRLRKVINGLTKDSTGAALASATVKLFASLTDVLTATLVSDASGFYEFSVYDDTNYYLVGYKAGAPDVTGATLNTIAGR